MANNPLAWISEQFQSLLSGPGRNTPTTTPPAMIESSSRTSLVFDSHVQEASKGVVSGKTKNPQTISNAWDEYNQWNDNRQVWQGLTQQERKRIMLDIYLQIPAASSCVDVISKRIFSGGLSVEKIDEEGPDNKDHYNQLMEFCLRINEDWDFLQLGRSLVQDKLIYGECYSEIIWKAGLPYNLVKVDCPPMGYKADKYGRIVHFYQEMENTRKRNLLDPKDIIRWWFPHPRASIDPFAPVEKVQDAILLNKKMTQWQTTFFQKGAKFPFYVKGVGDENEADRYMAWFTQNNAGEKNAHKPMITWGTAELAALGNMGALDMDFEKGLDRSDTIIYGGFGVPPAAVSIIKTGAMGGHSEAEQDKLLIFNACDPVKGGFFEKLNYRVTKRGFNIHDYRITSTYADYRSDKDVAEVEDKRIRNGSRTIDEIRMEGGKRPYKAGGDVAVIVTTKEVTPVPRLADMEAEQRQTAAVTLDTAKAGADLAQTKAKQAKEPPPEPVAQINEKPAQDQGKNAVKPAEKPTVPSRNQDETKQESEQPNTGVMVAFMLDAQTAEQIALSGGEPVDQLHVTLAFLGDAIDFTERLAQLKQTLAIFAATQPPLSGKIAGLGRFQAPEGQSDAIIALPDVPGLPEFRQALVGLLNMQGCPVNQEHGYTPHVTLAYIDKSMPMPIRTVENVPLYFDRICLAVGDERYYFPLLNLPASDESEETKEEAEWDALVQSPHSQEALEKLADKVRAKIEAGQFEEGGFGIEETNSPVPDNLWVRPDEDTEIIRLREQGVIEVTWGDHPGSCEMCMGNAGHTVKLGETFPSGHKLAPAHPNCICPMAFIHGDGNIEIEKDREDPNALTHVNDPDITQSMKAVKVKRTVSNRDE